MGYRDARVNESRVHTRITDSGSGREQQCGTITIWRTESGLQWGPRLGFDPRCGYGDGCPGCLVGVVSPKCLNGDDAWAGDRCSVRGPSGHPGCLRDRQDDFEVLEGLLMWVRCFVRVGREADWVPSHCGQLGLVRISLRVLWNVTESLHVILSVIDKVVYIVIS